MTFPAMRIMLKLRGMDPGLPMQPLLPPDVAEEQNTLQAVQRVLDNHADILEHAGMQLR